MTKPRQLPPLKGQSEMRANLSLPLPFSTPPSFPPSFFFFFFPYISHNTCTLSHPGLHCLKLHVMALFTSTRPPKKGHAEREKERKGLAAALPVCFLFRSVFHVQKENDSPVFVVAAALAAILALCTHQNPSNLSVHLIS